MKFIKKIKPFHVDERGEMSYLLNNENNITSALYITCKKGAIRANHYHKKDTHYSYMLTGSMEYTYQDAKDKNAKKHTVIVGKGEVVESPPMTMHAMKFLEDSTFIALTTESRDQKKYEKDTIHVKLV